MMKYRNYRIWHDPPPIPTRSYDWHYQHEDFDGPGDHRYGHCSSLAECKDEIDERYDNGDA